MYNIFVGLFDRTLVTLKLSGGTLQSEYHHVAYAVANTIIRASALALFTYGAIRVVITAVSHGSF